jgi:myo-inositol-1-phosphate synthase
MLVDSFRVDSPNVEYTEEKIESSYEYQTTEMFHEKNADGKYEWVARPRSATYQFATNRKVPKLGYALVFSFRCKKHPPFEDGIRWG